MENRRKREEREDREFKALIRDLFRYLKAYHHHLGRVEAGDEDGPPAKMQRMAFQISAGIQPAFPMVSTEWLILGNAKNWLNTGTDILVDHHEKALQEVGLAVSHASRVRWREAWEIAVKWARRGLKSLRESTVCRSLAEVTRLLTREEGDEEDEGGEVLGYVPVGSCAGLSSSPSGREAGAREEGARGSQVVAK